MKILVSDYSGFCFGVKKAVATAYDSADKEGNIYTYGPIIHNSMVVNELEQKGIRKLDSIEKLNEGDTVIIRSHGVSKSVVDELLSKKVNIIDATCPYVENIHRKVEEYYKKGYEIVIIGDADHPEVQGIAGWCENKAIIIDDEKDVKELKRYPKVCIVAQTTANVEKFKSLVLPLLDISKELVIFNTICNATEQRQKSAEELSKKCDAVIVLGGYNSSNTKKLVEICKKYCNNTFHVETINELDTSKLRGISILGITAGASTPDCIIKEAIEKMENIENTNEKMTEQSSLMDEYEKTLIRLHDGDIVKGRIIYVTDDEATVDLGYKADGIIPRDEISIDGDVSPREVLNPGEEVEVFILKVNDGEGNVLLSKKKVDAEKNIEYVEEKFNSKEIVDARITGIVKGGLTAEVKGVRVFIPASQADIKYVEDFSVFAGKTMKIIITEFDPDRRRIIGSRKVVLENEAKIKKQQLLESIQPGQILSGKVSRLTDFGVFVDLGGIDGLIHVSELSWGRVKHPSEIVKVGDTVETYVLSVDKEKERISLSLKKTVRDPWEVIGEEHHVGDLIEGKVVRIVPFGAFVQIVPGVDGLVHISQISEKRINKVEDILTVGTTIKAKIVELNITDKKLSLSIKEAVEDENRKENEEVLSNKDEEKVTIADMIDKNENE